RSHTVAAPTATPTVVTSVAKELLATIDPAAGVRLFGISVSNLVEAQDEQLTLDTAVAAHTGWDDASRAVDAIRARFGDRAVGPATLVETDGLHLKREGDTQWGPRGKNDR
ncbi:MAG: hypothetical protein M3Q68_09515, partial [Actinomycetota bacterium]|nr:hypothetical protein [Actinomycetota bacterium]